VISPVMATSRRNGMPVITDTMAVSMAAPLPPVHSGGQGSCLWTQAHSRKLPQVLRRQLPSLALGHEFNECPMEGISCRSHHFGVVEVPDTQKDRDLKTYGRTIHLKCDTNLLILLAAAIATSRVGSWPPGEANLFMTPP
jgi:hypothetical protein